MKKYLRILFLSYAISVLLIKWSLISLLYSLVCWIAKSATANVLPLFIGVNIL